MSEYEPITNELRAAVDYAPQFLAPDVAQVDAGEFERCCDAIDAIHAGLERENAELRERVAVLDNKRGNMHDGWVRLPLDADGVPWHINDEFEIDEGIAHVNGIGDNRLFYIDNNGMQWTRADNKLHHHAPTVEDVLREFADIVRKERVELATISEDTIAEYAAKLRLAGDAE